MLNLKASRVLSQETDGLMGMVSIPREEYNKTDDFSYQYGVLMQKKYCHFHFFTFPPVKIPPG
jgi:hypothetical protein